MTTDATPPEGDATPQDGSPGAPAQEPTTFDADYVKNLRAEAAKYRTEARANAEAAKKLAEFEDAQKTETQRLSEAKAAAETDAATARAEALRWRIAAKNGISDEDADVFLTGTDEDTLTRQAERLVALAGQSTNTTPPPGPRPDLSQGARNGAGPSDPAQEFAHFINAQLR